ncbi:VOC family protein [Gayadomonas joobiniege]|uniref:VOC family protein n=1 Tax=Gayadomonas joobiniege TaxID=1234606 RepID=UPI00035EB8FF|nr:VOC family protein [Gayadomonas joobiniege]
MLVTPYINFNGNCKEALAFYNKAMGANTKFMMTWAEAPDMDDKNQPPEYELPDDLENSILHASFEIGGHEIMACDVPAKEYKKAQGVSISIAFDSLNEIERVYSELAADGDVSMPLTETFWAERFAMVTDKYGVPWMLNLLKECQG